MRIITVVVVSVIAQEHHILNIKLSFHFEDLPDGFCEIFSWQPTGVIAEIHEPAIEELVTVYMEIIVLLPYI